MFPDPESAYLQGKAWHEEQEAKAMEVAANATESDDEKTTTEGVGAGKAADKKEGGEE